MTDPQTNALAELEAATSVLSSLAWLATLQKGPQRAQTVSTMVAQAERVNKLLAASERFGNGPPRRRRVSRWRLAMPTDPPAGE
ncbi:MAG: hypothetical protein J0H09_04040 [Burkholderiales bacterium]|mgnify:CR=1 FL=1|nr:hypothetical protein [Burkholderiales bacterium]ODU52912.1 MAG: hypothetical protein ABT09_02285 [bacterium SCN 57-13]